MRSRVESPSNSSFSTGDGLAEISDVDKVEDGLVVGADGEISPLDKVRSGSEVADTSVLLFVASSLNVGGLSSASTDHELATVDKGSALSWDLVVHLGSGCLAK